MDPATIGMAANLITTAIVAVTAFAALRQIRHNHMANELQLYLHFVNELNGEEMRGMVDWTGAFAERMKDSDYREAFARDPTSEDVQRFITILRFFERYASLVIVSGLSEHLLFHEYAGMIVNVWENTYQAVGLRRNARNPYALRAFEHLAMKAKQYEAKRMARDYARLERDPRLLAAEATAPDRPRGSSSKL